jgi:DNA-binding MarR family transcriptional regulator
MARGLGQKLKYDRAMSDEAPAGVTRVRRALAGLELAALRHRSAVKRVLGVGDEELCALLHLVHHGGASQRQLAELTTLSRSGTGAMVQRLEQHGLVQRRPQPGDRRARVVELSPAGRERMQRAYRELDAALAAALPDSPDADLDALARLLDRIGHAADRAQAELGGASPAPPPPPPGEPIWRRWG